MAAFFNSLLTASFHGSIVILAVILLRLLLRNTPRKFFCMLWLLAGVRLLMPFEIQSNLSLQPDPVPIVQQISSYEPLVVYPDEPVDSSPQHSEDADLLPVFTPVQGESEFAPEAQIPDPVTEDAGTDWRILLPWIWMGVASLFLIYTLYSYISLRMLVREAIRIEGGWECDRIETAFILGFIRPQIYIPMGLSNTVRRHILAHERTHLEKGDHWFKMIGFVALSLHWFNPLVWIAYILLCKDIEIACDERVVQFMELPERKEYSAALLNCSTNRKHFAACPVAFGEVSIKDRIKSVLMYKKPGFWISLAGVIAIAFVAVCLVTSPAAQEPVMAEDPGREVIAVSNVNELLEAIGPDREILLEPGIYDISKARDYGKKDVNSYYTWEDSYDGHELVLCNLKNLTIRGSGRLATTIETDPRWANVLRIRSCSNIVLEGFTAGHTRQRGECSGGVLFLEGSSNITMHELGLFGCGVVGLNTVECADVVLTGTEIYECSSSAVSLRSTSNATVANCRVYDIGQEEYGGYTFLEVGDCGNVTVENCEFSGSTLNKMVVATGSQLTLRNNLFTENRIRSNAFTVNGENVVLEANRFEGNTIRSWYDGYGSMVYDPQGNPLHEADLNTMYPPEQKQPTQPQLRIHVTTVDELIAAIGPNKEIILEGEMYDLSTATGYGSSSGDYYYWEDIFDGPGLVIRNVDNMTIRSSDGNVKKHTISAVPRYADVLAFSACSNVTISGFTAGHTREPGSCAGGVIEFRDCDNMTVDNCGLYGCGILGVYAEYSQKIRVINCDIYECSQGGIQMRDTNNITISGNTFRDLGGEPTRFTGCSNILLDGQLLNPQSGSGPVSHNPDAAIADEEDAVNLGQVISAFADALFRGDKMTMQMHLVSDFAFPVAVPESVLGATLSAIQKLPSDYARDMEARGYCTVSAGYVLPGQEISTGRILLEMCRENGIWKVQYYTAGTSEIDQLDTVLGNFLWAYLHQDRDNIAHYLAAEFSRSPEVYSGNGQTAVKDDSYSVGNTFSNANLAGLDSYSAAVPFKKADSDASWIYLNIALRRSRTSDNQWEILDYGIEPGAATGLSAPQEGIRIDLIEGENYTGVVMLIDDPSLVFLGTSTPGDFSADIPGKRIGEMFDIYPNALGAVNAGAFYDDGTDSPAVGSYPLGLAVSGGRVCQTPAMSVGPGMEGFAGFNRDNSLVVFNHNLTPDEAEALDIRDGCSMGPALIINSFVQPGAKENSGYGPRTAIGQKADGTVILLCINGRVFHSLGATYEEVTAEMIRYGAVNACMMQGGSATGMMYRTDLNSKPQLYTSIYTPSGDQELTPRRLPTYWIVRAY